MFVGLASGLKRLRYQKERHTWESAGYIEGLSIIKPVGADAANLRELLDAPGAPLLGVLPPLPPGARPAPGAIDLDPLLG